ncbi:hypothetical protein LguiB_009572 [Lonicera macranthoides]
MHSITHLFKENTSVSVQETINLATICRLYRVACSSGGVAGLIREFQDLFSPHKKFLGKLGSDETLLSGLRIHLNQNMPYQKEVGLEELGVGTYPKCIGVFGAFLRVSADGDPKAADFSTVRTDTKIGAEEEGVDDYNHERSYAIDLAMGAILCTVDTLIPRLIDCPMGGRGYGSRTSPVVITVPYCYIFTYGCVQGRVSKGKDAHYTSWGLRRHTLLGKTHRHLTIRLRPNSYRFESSLTILNNGLDELKSFRVFVGFQHDELLVSASNAVLADGTSLPALVGNGTLFAGYPSTDLKTAVETAGDVNQMSAQIDFLGMVFGVGAPRAIVRAATDEAVTKIMVDRLATEEGS